MKSICLFFQVHQPFRFRRYRFFDIGNDHYYYNDYANETYLRKVAGLCYLPVNKLLLELIKKNDGNFKVAFSITGTALDQFKIYTPEVIDSFQQLAKTGCVEFLSETYSHSLSSLKNKNLFQKQVQLHDDKIFELFGQKPQVFRNTEMIYSDEIGAMVADMGFKAMLTEGAKHILGWKSPNFLYVNAINPRLKVLMRNFKLSDDILFRFSNTKWPEYPLTSEKFVSWIKKADPNEELVNIFLGYDTFGLHHSKESGIFDFLKNLPSEVLKTEGIRFSTPSEIIADYQPISAVSVPHPIAWANEENDVNAWLGNELQQEASDKLYQLEGRMQKCTDLNLVKDWNYLLESSHFYYMSTKFFSKGKHHNYNNPYDSPYEAFINYMNVLSDFKLRLNSIVPVDKVEVEIASLTSVIEEKEARIKIIEAEIKSLKAKNKTVSGTKKRKK